MCQGWQGLIAKNNNIDSMTGHVMIKNVLLIKGYGAPHEDRFQAHEAKYAKERGLHVAYPEDIPDFVDGAIPTVQAFREFIIRVIERDSLEPDRTVVLPHSLGGNGWIQILQEREDIRACLTIFMGTPLDNHTGLRVIDDFFPTPNLDLTSQERRRILVVGSNNDSVIHEPPSVLGEHLSADYLTIPGAGHFMPHALHQNPNEMDLGREWMKIRRLIGALHLPY